MKRFPKYYITWSKEFQEYFHFIAIGKRGIATGNSLGRTKGKVKKALREEIRLNYCKKTGKRIYHD